MGPASDILIRGRHIKFVIICPRADFSWDRHFNVTQPCAIIDDGYQTIAAWAKQVGHAGDKSRVRRCKAIASRRPPDGGRAHNRAEEYNGSDRHDYS